jgi:hypothetical protein
MGAYSRTITRISRVPTNVLSAPALQAGARRCDVVQLVAFRGNGASHSRRSHLLFAA